MTAEHKYEMTISLQIVEHLGLNLYSNTSAVISEAVANAWDADAKTVEIDVINAGLTREEQEARLDVRYQKPSGKHVIIELKRGDRTVKFIELIAQVDKYFSALTKILKKHDTDEDFEIIVLLGKRLDGEKVDHDIESKHLRQLAEVNTRILYYDQLLANAETLYADFIAQNSSLASLETLINSIE